MVNFQHCNTDVFVRACNFFFIKIYAVDSLDGKEHAFYSFISKLQNILL